MHDFGEKVRVCPFVNRGSASIVSQDWIAFGSADSIKDKCRPAGVKRVDGQDHSIKDRKEQLWRSLSSGRVPKRAVEHGRLVERNG